MILYWIRIYIFRLLWWSYEYLEVFNKWQGKKLSVILRLIHESKYKPTIKSPLKKVDLPYLNDPNYNFQLIR